jgi:hypothetical protein
MPWAAPTPGNVSPLISVAGKIGAERVDERRDVAERHHVARGVTDLYPREVVRTVPERKIGLGRHVVGPAIHVEVVDVARTKVGLDGAVGVLAQDAKHLGPLAIEVDLDLRRRGRERGVDTDQPRGGVGGGDEIVRRLGESGRAQTRPVLQPHGEPAGAADAGDRRRLDDQDVGTIDAGHALYQLLLDRLGGLAVLHPLLERFEHDVERGRTR